MKIEDFPELFPEKAITMLKSGDGELKLLAIRVSREKRGKEWDDKILEIFKKMSMESNPGKGVMWYYAEEFPQTDYSFYSKPRYKYIGLANGHFLCVGPNGLFLRKKKP